MEDEIEVKNLEELQDAFSLSKVKGYYEDGQLMEWLRGIYWTIVNKKDTIFKYIFWERLDFLPIPECCFHFVWCQIA